MIYEESQKDAQLFTKRILMLDMEFWFFVGCKKRENKHISALISRMVVFNKDRVWDTNENKAEIQGGSNFLSNIEEKVKE